MAIEVTPSGPYWATARCIWSYTAAMSDTRSMRRPSQTGARIVSMNTAMALTGVPGGAVGW